MVSIRRYPTTALTFGLFYVGWAAILPAAAADCFGYRANGSIHPTMERVPELLRESK